MTVILIFKLSSMNLTIKPKLNTMTNGVVIQVYLSTIPGYLENTFLFYLKS